MSIHNLTSRLNGEGGTLQGRSPPGPVFSPRLTFTPAEASNGTAPSPTVVRSPSLENQQVDENSLDCGGHNAEK